MFLLKRMRANNGPIPFVVPEPQPSVVAIFTDGPARNSESWELAFCAGAGVVFTNTQSYIKVDTFGEPLPGHDHSSFRGESFAILLTLNRYWSPCIYTDCQAVVNGGPFFWRFFFA